MFIDNILQQGLSSGWFGVRYHNIVPAISKAISFSSGVRAFLFSSLFPKEMWRGICILAKLKTTLRNQYAAHSERSFDRPLDEGGIVRPFIESDCVGTKKGVICTLFYFIMKPKLLQLMASSWCNISFICLHRDHWIWMEVVISNILCKIMMNNKISTQLLYF